MSDTEILTTGNATVDGSGENTEATNAAVVEEETAGEVNTSNSAEFPTRILHDFDGVQRKSIVTKDENGEFVVTVADIPLLNEDGTEQTEEVLQPKKDETGSAVMDPVTNEQVMEPALNEDGSPKTKVKLDPASGRFIKYPSDQDFSSFETWQE